MELAGAAPGPGVVAGVRQPHVADAGRGDHHHRHRAPRRRQLDHHALVDREQTVDTLDEARAHRPAQAGDVVVRGEPASHRRVHAVVVARRQVDRGEGAAVELLGQRRVDHQVAQPVVVALGLDERTVGDRARRADRPIARRHQRRVGDRPRPGIERPREEVAEAGEARQRRVDLVEAGPHRRGEGAVQRRPERPRDGPACRGPDDRRVRRLRRPAKRADGHAVTKLGEVHAEGAWPWVQAAWHQPGPAP